MPRLKYKCFTVICFIYCLSGLKSLVLPSLQLLNLDGTKVRPDIQELMVTNCPRLAQVSLRNLEPYTLEDQEADMEVDS